MSEGGQSLVESGCQVVDLGTYWVVDLLLLINIATQIKFMTQRKVSYSISTMWVAEE